MEDTLIKLGRLLGTVDNQTPNYGGFGIFIQGVGLLEVRSNSIYQAMEALVLSDVRDGAVTDNLFSDNRAGITLTETRGVSFSGNVLSGTEFAIWGIYVGGGATHNSFVNNKILYYPLAMVFIGSDNVYSDNRVALPNLS